MAKPKTPKKSVKDTQAQAKAQIEDAVVVEEPGVVTDGAETSQSIDPSDETPETPATEPLDPPPPDTDPVAPQVTADTPKRTGTFVPLVIGGIVAGAIGFGAATYLKIGNSVDPVEFQSALGAKDRQIENLTAELDALKEQVGAVDQRIKAVSTQGSDALASKLAAIRVATDKSLASISDRLAAIENRTTAQIATGDAGLGTLQGELDALRAAIKAQTAQSQTLATDLGTLKDQAQAKAAKEVATNKTVLARAALSQIRAAIDSGVVFDQALGNFQRYSDTSVDPDLARLAKTGVPSLPQLQDSFAPAARDALASARVAEPANGTFGKLQNFLKGQLGVRSLEPKEGTGPDAVLSRAEAALGAGDVAGTLDELKALSPAGRAKMAAWEAKAKTRVNALAAADALSQAIK